MSRDLALMLTEALLGTCCLEGAPDSGDSLLVLEANVAVLNLLLMTGSGVRAGLQLCVCLHGCGVIGLHVPASSGWLQG